MVNDPFVNPLKSQDPAAVARALLLSRRPKELTAPSSIRRWGPR